MEGGDVSLLIRRARRAGSKRLDLSNRGLQTWPEEIFSLTQLQAIDASGNKLTSIGISFAQLSALEELDVSNNLISSFDDLAVDSFPAALLAVNLEGNPVASSIDLATRRHLADPLHGSAERPSQVLRKLIKKSAAAAGADAPPQYVPTPVVKLESQGSFGSRAGGSPLSSRPTSAAGGSLARAAPSSQAGASSQLDLELERILAADGDHEPAWRKAKKAMQQEMDGLRERIKELEEQSGSHPVQDDASKPSWLQDSAGRRDLSHTLPSRRGNLTAENEVAEIKTALQEEQRKSKRLEQEVQRLTERLSESRSSPGSVAGSAVPQFDLSEVELGEQISQGGFSVIHRAHWHSTKVAVKKLFDPNINEELLAEFDNEVQKLGQLRHPNILMLLAVHRKPPALSLIMELVEGGSMYQLLHLPHQFQSSSLVAGGVPQREMLRILETVAVVLSFLHARGIVHRDVKTHNVLLTPGLEVKVCDFGLARMRSELMTGTMQFAGTPNYMAPEIFKNQKYTDRVDVFAFGTLMWESMAVDIPFANLDPPEIRDRVLVGRMLPVPTAAPPPLQAAIEACWTVDQAARPGMAEILGQVREAGRADASTVRAARRPRTATGARDISGAVGFHGTSLM